MGSQQINTTTKFLKTKFWQYNGTTNINAFDNDYETNGVLNFQKADFGNHMEQEK